MSAATEALLKRAFGQLIADIYSTPDSGNQLFSAERPRAIFHQVGHALKRFRRKRNALAVAAQ